MSSLGKWMGGVERIGERMVHTGGIQELMLLEDSH